jgi:integrase
LTNSDTLCHRLPRLSHFGDDTVMTRKQPPQKLTDNLLRRLPAPVRGNTVTFDITVKGFGARITAAGARAFILNYRRKADGRQRQFTIGSYPDWGVTAAREEAKRLKRAIDGGADPVGEQEENRAAAAVADLCTRFERDYLPRKRPSTQRVYRQQIRTAILPVFGKMKVAAVTHADVDGFHHRLSARAPTHANRTLAVLSRMFNLAIRWGWRIDNPCRGVERNQEHRRTKYLSSAEIARLSTALTELRDQNAANAVRLLLFTGARQGELLAAKWADIDLEVGVWAKPASTTKQAAMHRVPLSTAAVQLLAEMRAQADDNAEWIFPARGGGHRPHVNEAWIKARKAAKLDSVRLHDLRHAYASILASAGLSLPVIGALLGHTTPVTTARYAHLLDDPFRQATERASAIITGRAAAEIVPLGKRGRR